LPRFDSGACLASLLGGREHGCFLVAPRGGTSRVERRYRSDSLVLETDFHTPSGVVRVVDAMPVRGVAPDVVRIVEGVAGTVVVDIELVLRFDYGRTVPWVKRADGRLQAIAGPNAVVVATPAHLHGANLTTVASLTLREGDRMPLVLTWYPSNQPAPESPDPFRSIDDTDRYWREWASRCRFHGEYRDDVVRSLLTIKALTYAPTGGIVAAGTTSLPESLGGERNWDYRYCWLRDAAFSLYALLHAGYSEEAAAWRDWLLRAVAGSPKDLQIVYGPAGERYLDERTLDWLPGYEGARPVRIGNAAVGQLQLDVYGEVLDTLHQARRLGVPPDPDTWPLQRTIAEWLESNWSQPDESLWEMRGGRHDFTFSKIMAWVAMDRVIKAVKHHEMEGPVDRWRRTREEIHRDVCTRAWDADKNAFTQSYGSKLLDASLLLIPAVGFLPAHDRRVMGTLHAIERELMSDGFVARYPTGEGRNVDGMRGVEGAFLACSFWLVDAYVLAGRRREARELFERLLGVRNDLGLLSEEYDPRRRRLVGNFPQAFSHVALVNSARALTCEDGAAQHRRDT
jgi:GH15 family glucan-1,4-alpha-glucosidase